MDIWKIRRKEINLDDGPIVMGILNVTPDSFSDGGKFNSLDAAIAHAQQMVDSGAKIIDVGGESTRPGYTMISDEEEIERVSPVIEAIAARIDVAISIDTYKSKVAEAALKSGADIVNDVHGFRYDPKIAEVTSRYNAGAVLMANFSEKKPEEDVISYKNDCYRKSLEIADANGITMDQILMDPGIGFGTSRDEDICLIRDIRKEDRILLGASRKRIVAALLDRETKAFERANGSVGVALAGVAMGARIVRVHDVAETYDALLTYSKLMGI